MRLPEPNEMTRLAISYTALRLGLFAVVFIALQFVPMAEILKLAIALVASAIVSFPLGRHQRDRMAALLDERRRAKAAQGR